MADGDDGANEANGHNGPRAPGEPAKGWVNTPPLEPIYASMWTAYREGARSVSDLSRRTGVSHRVAQTAINRGWPENEWPPLRERWTLFEKQAEAERLRELARDREAAKSAGRSAAHVWADYQKKWMPVLEMAPDIMSEMGRRLRNAVNLATFVRYRKVRKFNEQLKRYEVEDQAYVDGAAFAKAMSLWVGAVKEAPAAMRYLLGVAVDQAPPAPPELTPEQEEALARGELPPGVTIEQLGALLLAGGKVGEAG